MRDKGLVFEEARRARQALGAGKRAPWPEFVGLLLGLLSTLAWILR